MRISRLVIKHFRSIEHLDVDLPQFCALVGANNAGKSNVLLALARVFGRGWIRLQDFDDDLDRYRRDPDRDIEISVTLDQPLEWALDRDYEGCLSSSLGDCAK